MDGSPHHREEASGRRLFALSLLALGIVYGDIGTSPLYAMRECFYGAHPVAVSPGNIFGVLSLIFWSLVVVVMLKYNVYVIRFDNRGEGGIFALMGLVGMEKSRRAAVKASLIGFVVLGAVFLVTTGGEALYADLGHFGEKPIQVDWFSIVGPSLVLQYFGQGALLIKNPGAAHNPFYLLAPKWALYPLVVLATIATVIASQAIISGVFSLTRQAIQLGYFPRMQIVHTSTAEIGQVYMPAVNWAVMVATIVLVVSFRSSSNLAGAYGVAVSMTMIITTLLAYFVAR